MRRTQNVFFGQNYFLIRHTIDADGETRQLNKESADLFNRGRFALKNAAPIFYSGAKSPQNLN